MNKCKDKTKTECLSLVDECSWCDGKTRKYCRKRPGRHLGNRGRQYLSKVKTRQKTCKRVSPTRCSPYDGEMAEGCSLSDKNRCVSVKGAKRTGSKKSAVKIISWNVNGIRSKSQGILVKGSGAGVGAGVGAGGKQFNAKSNMALLLKKYNPDILCLQETKCQCKNVDEFKEILPFTHQAWSCSTEKLGYSGVAVLSKIPFKQLGKIPGLEDNTQGRSLFLEFPGFYLVNVYVPNSGTNQNYRKDVWDKAIYKFLHSMKGGNKGGKKPIIYCGDLNVVSGENDIYNPDIIERGRSPGVKPFERENFKTILDMGYVDVLRYLNGDKKLWTWWDMRSRARLKDKGWRLDYFLVSRQNIIKKAGIYKEIYGSDHCPIGLDIRV